MFASITLMRLRGKALTQDQIRQALPVRANIIVAHHSVPVLGRYSDVASAQSTDGSPSLLPELYDCRLAHMGPGGFVLSGMQLDGTMAWAQAWWCRPD
jgi:hypothetical protein